MNQPEDVEIMLSRSRHYKFHSGTLARNSTFFDDMLTDETATKLSNRAKTAGVTVRWMFELVCMPCDEHPAGILELVELTNMGDRADGRTGMVVNENGRLPQAEKVFDRYETVFYAMYNRTLKIDETSMGAALQDCCSILDISEYLGCTSIVSKPIEVKLLKHGQDLFRGISAAPHAWVLVAFRIKSELIFKECMIHMVGNWKRLRTDESAMEMIKKVAGLRPLIEKYHRHLLEKCKAFEGAISCWYPQAMREPADDHPIKRESYARDILIWMALTWFRHWFNSRLQADQGRHGLDCGFGLYEKLSEGGENYMNQAVVNEFHQKFPITKKGLTVIGNHLSEIKDCLKEVVKRHKMMKTTCELDTGRYPVKYLTFTEFNSADFPWTKKGEKRKSSAMKPSYQPGGNDIARQNLEVARQSKEHASSVAFEDEQIEGEFFGLEVEDEDEDEDDEEVCPPNRKRARKE